MILRDLRKLRMLRIRCFVLLSVALLPLWRAMPAYSEGTWVPLTNQAPDDIDTMLLLTDGRVMAASGEPGAGGIGNAWYLLTPDANGSYINGTWSTLAPMNYTRLYYSSQVLRDGRVLVAGGEYGTGTNAAEVYDPLANTWTITPPPPPGQVRFHDSISDTLPNGDVLVAPVTPAVYGGTDIYSVVSNLWFPGPILVNDYYEDEASWVKLPDGSILTIDPFGTDSERYIPSVDEWINDSTLPVPIYGDYEMGPAFLLANSNAFFLGGTGNTAFYTPSGCTNPGVWTAGPVIPDSQVTADAPGAMMVNGDVLFTTTPSTNDTPVSFYEFDPVANAIDQVDGPLGLTFESLSFGMRMLDLPDGTILFSDTGPQLFVYQPDGSPLAEGQPSIATLSTNSNGSYHLTGRVFTGISEGAAYGDDAQMASDYPIVRLTSASGVYYARSTNWTSTLIMTGTNIVSTDFTLPASLPVGLYSLVVSANGNASAPISFVYTPDALLVQPGTGITFIGTQGGPFGPPTAAFTLTNVGGASLNWSLGNTSSWFQVASTGGTLTPGGPAANVTVSLNPSVTNMSFGTYEATIWFTNLTDGYVSSRALVLQVNPMQLVENGGFETGDFTDWNQSGEIDGYEFVTNFSPFVESGNYGAQIGPYGALYYLSQNLSTTPGQLYLLSFWVANYGGAGPNEFLADWGATTLYEQVDLDSFPYTNMVFFVTATNPVTTLQFGFRNDPYYFAFDNVSVTAVRAPSFQSISRSNGSVNLSWAAVSGPSYQLYYATNLAQPSWTPLGSQMPGTDGTITLTDPNPTDASRFYRLEMLP